MKFEHYYMANIRFSLYEKDLYVTIELMPRTKFSEIYRTDIKTVEKDLKELFEALGRKYELVDWKIAREGVQDEIRLKFTEVEE